VPISRFSSSLYLPLPPIPSRPPSTKAQESNISSLYLKSIVSKEARGDAYDDNEVDAAGRGEAEHSYTVDLVFSLRLFMNQTLLWQPFAPISLSLSFHPLSTQGQKMLIHWLPSQELSRDQEIPCQDVGEEKSEQTRESRHRLT
jgi:hypothetical protein